MVGRAGTGVDNVDVEAATRRGIVVCNAAGSNALSAAEHAIALLLSQARNIPQAHGSLVEGRWERSKFGGIEVTGKTLGVLGFGRIGQMVAERAKGLGMNVVAYDPLVAEGRYRELGVEKADTPDDLYRASDFITLHLASTPETRGFVGEAAFAAMKPGARLDQRGPRRRGRHRGAASRPCESGHLGGAGIDVFPVEPTTESPLFGLPGVVVTPHLGASTEEAQDRAGVVVAEQVAAALTGGVVTSAVNIPSVGPEALAVLGPFLPLAKQLGQLITALTGGPSPAGDLLRGRPGEPRHPDADLHGAGGRAERPGGGGRERRERGGPGGGARHRVVGDRDPAGPRLHEPPDGALRRREPVGHHRRHHQPAAAGVGVRRGHRHRAGPAHRPVPLPRHPGADRPRRDRSWAWRTSTSRRWRCRGRAARAAR